MSFSVSPFVSVREVDATAVTPAIITAPAAIAGVFRWGPVLERTLITSEEELIARFGKPTNLNAETFFTAASYLAYSNALYVSRVNNNANTANSATFAAKYPGALGNSIGVSYTDRESFSLSITNTANGNISINSSDFTVVSRNTEFLSTGAGTSDVEYLINENDILEVGNANAGYQNMIVDDVSVSATTVVESNTTINVYTYEISFKNRYFLSDDKFQDLTLKRKWGFTPLVEKEPTGNNVHIVVYDVDGSISGSAGSVLEVFNNVSLVPGTRYADGSDAYYETVLQNRSSYVNAKPSVTLEDFAYEVLSGGTEGASESAATVGSLARGYDLYREGSDVDIAFVLQGKATSPALPNYIVANVAERRKDCVAVLSPLQSNVVGITNPNVQLDNVLAYRAQIQNSSYWVMDSGYKYTYDKYNDVYRWVPLNGDIAGLMAKCEPWESPAGYHRGLIKNVVKLAFNPNKPQRDLLYGQDINPVISQTGQGYLLFGDKTGLGIDQSAFSRINVRRLFITIEKAIATVSESFLFENHDDYTQASFRSMVEPFLRDIQGKRGITDFRVICDSTINTADVIDRNILRANIFVKPPRSINFIELVFIAPRTGAEFEEIIGLQF